MNNNFRTASVTIEKTADATAEIHSIVRALFSFTGLVVTIPFVSLVSGLEILNLNLLLALVLISVGIILDLRIRN